MAKKKKRKNSDEGKVKFSAELTGIILVLVSIIGIGNFGPVGHVIKSFAIFLMGNWWAIFIILLLICWQVINSVSLVIKQGHLETTISL